MSDWHFKPAYELVKAIREGDVTSAALLDHFIARYEDHNGPINAIVATDFETARARAREADAALKRGEVWGPLHGLPMTIKDALEVVGMVTAGGAPEFATHRPATNAVAVQRIVDAGAVIFGKTNVPYLSGDLQTFNPVYGTTNNPWNHNCGPGGSSGGSAAALAAGLTPLELGSDIGGSIRTPAHLCGVFGHKPSYGIVPKQGHVPPAPGDLAETDLSVVGPLARSAQDLALLLKVVAGPNDDASRGWTLSLPGPRATSARDLRVGTWFEDPFCDIDREYVGLMKQAAQKLADEGAQVDWDAKPDVTLEEMTEVYLMLLHSVVAARMPASIKTRWEEIKKNAAPDDRSHQVLQARGGTMSYAEWMILHERREKLRAKWAEFFTRYDVLLCPTIIRAAFPHDQQSNFHARRLMVNGVERNYMDVLIWAGPAVAFYLPATVVPLGTTSEGLPVGMQIIGPHFEDYTPIEAARIVADLTGGFRAPPGY